ncbi:MAG: GtrA family protein [Bdellovibrionia bacterium]
MRREFLTSFGRAQISGLIASIVDYGSLFLMTEKFHVWYVIATGSGAFLGAITNFLLNRYWTFKASHGPLNRQALRYFFVSAGSLILNTVGVYLVTEFEKLHYAASVALVSLGVGIFYNYPLHKHFVYR